MADYDLIVVGGVPGMWGAIRAAQLAKSRLRRDGSRGRHLFELGLHPDQIVAEERRGLSAAQEPRHGIWHQDRGLSYEWDKIIGRSRKVADRLAGGIEMLFKKNKIDYIRGEAAIPKAGVVEVTDKDGKKSEHKAAKILVATGVVTRELPVSPSTASPSSAASRPSSLPSSRRKSSSSVPARSALSSPISSMPSARRYCRRDAAEHPPRRGYRGQRHAREVPRQAGIKILTSTKVEKTETTNKACASPSPAKQRRRWKPTSLSWPSA